MILTLARQNMVNNQLRPQGVRNPYLLKAFAEVDRTLFLLPSLQPLAYNDSDLNYHAQRFLMAPMVLAQLIESAQIQSHHRILVVACGTGYSLAILSFLCNDITGLESIPALAQQAQHNLSPINFVTVVTGSLREGTPGKPSYDIILIEGAVSEIPLSLTEQLQNGGRLVAIKRNTKNPYVLGRGIVMSRYDNSLTCVETFDAGTKLLPEFSTEETFSF